TIFPPQRQRNPRQPFAEYLIDVLRPERIADPLQLLRLGARQEAIVQGLIGDPLLLQLAFGPFVPVQTQLGGPGRVTAHFEEQRAKVRVVDVEVVVVDVNRLVAREQKLPVDLLALESLRLLLRHPHEYHPLSRSAIAFTSARNFSVTCPSTTGEGIGLPSCSLMNVTSPPDVAKGPM